VGSLENKNYVSKGGKLTIPAAKKLNFSSIKPKVIVQFWLSAVITFLFIIKI
jgi:hypothetical protein